ncbi:MAG: thiamine phosphate synthase [Bacteroidota bacterium]|nr:thiamine phosphate synthase [Bacteroidota bacterium]MDP3144186.1 thiamine phosphate synthase [Bacteroidota bacterium]
MLIVISYPTALKNEANLINQLFDEGLELLHLRKPNYSELELKQLIHSINPVHYSKLVFHQYHYLAKIYGSDRLHYPALNRKKISTDNLSETKKSGTLLSTSVHSIEEFENLPTAFSYAFLSPVFDSISKKNYKAVDFKQKLKTIKKQTTKLIALGGITKLNCTEPLSWGFDGVAVLGSVWESKNPIEEFVALKKELKKCEILF